jgi:hypothetical protein
MRWLAAALLVSACFAGAALAQTSEPPIAFTPTWAASPQPAELVRLYPAEPLRQNISGIAVLCCTPNPDGGIDCAISSEWPEGQGFGAASLRASEQYRLSAESFRDLQARPGAAVRLSMLWGAAVPAPGAIERLSQIDRETVYACLAPRPNR